VAREDKVAEVAEVRDRVAASSAMLLTHYRGLSVKDLAQLRTALRASNAELRVVKNTLAKRAVADAGIEGLDPLLVGPTGLVFCAEDPVGPAKALKAFAKDHPSLEIRGGFLDGAVLDAADAARLADLASREELLARFAGLMQGALAGFARLLQAPLSHQARLMQALVDKGGAAGESPAPAAPAAVAPADDAPATDESAEASAPAAEALEASAEDAPAEDAAAEDAEEPAAE
jgi:large subunit ribosomal protein L10